MNPRAVLFDLAGTLIKTALPEEIIGRILEKYGVKRSLRDIALAHRVAEESASLEDYGLPYYDFWIKWNRRVLEKLDVHENIYFLAKALVEEWWDNADLNIYPDAEETLLKLKSFGLKLGIVTNAFERDIEEVLKRVRIPRVFDVHVGIDTVKKPKPHPEIFLHAIRALNIEPREAIFVGDDLERDYVGALNAGLAAVLIDRGSTFDNARGRGIVKIRSLRDLLTLLGTGESGNY